MSDPNCQHLELEASASRPIYAIFPQDKPNPEGTQLYGISCNEGWRETIVCSHMYKYAADWLLEILQGKPFAKETRQ